MTILHSLSWLKKPYYLSSRSPIVKEQPYYLSNRAAL